MSEEYDNKALRAWQEWKVVCSILGCSKEHRKILAACVSKAFKRKIQCCVGCKLDGLFASVSYEDWAQEFDVGLIETALRCKEPERKQAKKWKDWLFDKVAASSDPPRRVIEGKLIGKKGIINDIAERYLRDNHSLLWMQKGDKRVYMLHASMDEKINPSDAGDGRTLGDTLASKAPPKLEDADLVRLRGLIDGKLTDVHAAILLVDLVSKVRQSRERKKLSLGMPELLQFTQLSQSTCYARYDNEIRPMLLELKAAVLKSPVAYRAVDFLISLLQEQLKSEKRAEALLLRIEKALHEE